ncbi:cytidine deaminase [Pelolinea submarina]|uniref:Cytidine deaminase n=1 Tax=Pelolinea submarina TaxID=913107 RepID=A0A347ZQ65_9CHLR|nr:cytidine deaminase [Pelolinea submarina]REG06226.1 cytidine deaminase [Pelolinea submarina]BBB47446.1 cytidine deaminase [Pelolinea submarina]
MIDTEMKTKLLAAAVKAAKNSYSPYSHFAVGAAILTKGGNIYQGTNIENVSYGGTVCAERVAVWKAVSEGELEMEAIAVVGPGTKEAYPCAMCRQVLLEFGLDMLVISGDEQGNYMGERTLRELVPFPFTPSALLGEQ